MRRLLVERVLLVPILLHQMLLVASRYRGGATLRYGATSTIGHVNWHAWMLSSIGAHLVLMRGVGRRVHVELCGALQSVVQSFIVAMMGGHRVSLVRLPHAHIHGMSAILLQIHLLVLRDVLVRSA